MKCEICGEDFKNLGVHKWQKHREEVPSETIIPVDNLIEITVDDHLPDKQLSRLILDLKEILRKYRSDITVKTLEQNGSVSEIEIIARIQPRR